MRKLFNFWPTDGGGNRGFSLLLPLCVIVALVLMVACALSKPQKTIVLNMVAQSSGVLLAQELPGVAREVLKYSEKVLKIGEVNFTEASFHEWSGEMIKRLDIHPLLKVNFAELIKLVDIEITLAENQQEIVKLAYKVIQNFIIGIKAGR